VPDNGGSAITSYMMYVRKSDSITYSTELINCDGYISTIIAANTCSIPVLVLHDTPFNLLWGTDVYVKVEGINIKGPSLKSVEGHRAVIIAIPDATINLTEDLTLRTLNFLGLTWQNGLKDGSFPIIDYGITVTS